MSRNYISPVIILLFSFIIISFFWIAVPYANAGNGMLCDDPVCRENSEECNSPLCCVSGECPNGACFWDGNTCCDQNPCATPTTTDHFKCYEAEGGSLTQGTFDLNDQFGPNIPNVPVKDVELFCNPVSKNGSTIQNADAHLTCYRIEAENEEGMTLTAENQFDTTTLTLDEEAVLLCVPTLKSNVQTAD